MNYLVKFTAKLNNITNLKPFGGDGSQFGCSFEMACTNCGGIKTKYIHVIPNQNWPNIRNAPTGALKVGNVTINTNVARPLTQEMGVRQEYTPLLQLKCTGFSPIKCIFGGFWSGDSMSEDKSFNDIDLTGEEYELYDDEGDLEVGIYQPHAIFELLQNSKSKKGRGESSVTNVERYSK